jgi:hypothetical protein
MPKRVKKTVNEMIVDQYIKGERDLRKIGRKHKITSTEVMEILEKNGIL